MGHCRTHGVFTQRMENENRGGKIEIHEGRGQGPLLDGQ